MANFRIIVDPNVQAGEYWTVIEQPDGTFVTNNGEQDSRVTVDQFGWYCITHVVNDPGDVTAPGYQVPNYPGLPTGQNWSEEQRTQYAYVDNTTDSFTLRFDYLETPPAPFDCSAVITDPENQYLAIRTITTNNSHAIGLVDTSSDPSTFTSLINIGPFTSIQIGFTYEPINQVFYVVSGGVIQVVDAAGRYSALPINREGIFSSFGTAFGISTNGDGYLYAVNEDSDLIVIDVRDPASATFGDIVFAYDRLQTDLWIAGTAIQTEDTQQGTPQNFWFCGDYLWFVALGSTTGGVNGTLFRMNPATGETEYVNLVLNETERVSMQSFMIDSTCSTLTGLEQLGDETYEIDLTQFVDNGTLRPTATTDGTGLLIQSGTGCIGARSQEDRDSIRSKTVDKAFAQVGEELTYTVNFQNVSLDTMTGVSIQDILPANTSYVPGSLLINGVPDNGDLAAGVALPDLAIGDSVQIVFRALVDSAPDTNPIQNIANFAYTVLGEDRTATAGPAETIIGDAPDFTGDGFIKSVDQTEAVVGDTLTYTLDLTNNGTADATNVLLTDIIPPETTLVDGTLMVNGGPATGDLVNGVEVGTITANGGTAQVTFQVTIDSQPGDLLLDNTGVINYNFITNNQELSGMQVSNTVFTVVPTQQGPDLSGSFKTVNQSVAFVGDTLTYTIVVRNTGGTDATSVNVQDILPSGTSFVDGSLTVDGVATGETPDNVNIATVSANGGTATIVFQATVDTLPDPNPIINFATITDASGGSVTTNNATTQVNQRPADLSGTTKTLDNQTPSVGDIITYTITIPNTGELDATNLILTDPLTTGLSYVPGSATVNGSAATGDPTAGGIEVGTIPANGSVTVAFQVNVDAVTTPNPFTNIANLNFNNGIGTVDLPVVGQPLVVLEPGPANLGSSVKLVSNQTPNVGDVITYTVIAVNNGTQPATNVVLEDALTTGLSYVSGSATVDGAAATGDPTAGGIQVGTIPGPGVATITFDVSVDTIPDPNPFTNVADLIYDDGQGGRVTDMITGQSITATSPGGANLDGSNKSVNNPNPQVGDTITYTINLVNSGQQDATNVVVTDPLPAELQFVGGSALVGGVVVPGDNVSGIQVGTVPANSTVQLTFQVNVTGIPTPNPFLNTANFTYDDGNGNNVSGSVTGGEINVGQTDGANLGNSTKDVSNATPQVGDTITYTINVQNSGAQAATNIVITDTFPAALQYVPGTTTVGGAAAPDGPTTGINIASLAAGSSVLVTFDVLVNAIPTPNPYPNTADIAYDDGLGNRPTTPVTGGEIDVQPAGGANLGNSTKDVSNATPQIGDTVTYTIDVRNTGLLAATNIVITDMFPAGLQYVPGTTTVGGAAAPDGPTTGINIASLAAGSSVVVTFDVLVNAIPTPNPYPNTADIAYDDGLGNRPTTPVTGGEIDVQPAGANLGNATKTGAPDPVTVGDELTYTISVTNTGDETATNMSLFDQLPPEVSYVPGSLTINGVSVPDNAPLPDLMPNASLTVTFRVLVNTLPASGEITNEATLNYTDSNGPGSVTTPPVTTDVVPAGAADLGNSTKTVSNPAPQIGDTVTYTITVNNTGAQAATNIVIQDALTAGLDYIPGTTTVGGAVAPDGPLTGINIASLAANSSVVVTFQVLISAIPTPNPYTNIADITYDDGTGNRPTTQVPGTPIDVGGEGTGGSNLGNTSKFVDNGNPAVGDIVTYTIEIPNDGTEVAQSVKVFDPLTVGLTLVGTPTVVGAVGVPSGNLLVAPGLTIGSILPGTTATVTFQVRVDAIPTPNPYINTATITYTDSNGTTSFPAQGGHLNVGRPDGADLGGATKKASDVSPEVGDLVTYTVTLPNNGPAAATNVTVFDAFAPGIELVEVVSVTGSSGPVTGELDVSPGLNIGTIIAGGTAVITFTVEVAAIPNPNPFENKVDVTYTDPTGTYTGPVTGGALTVEPSDGANLTGATKGSEQAQVVEGDIIKYTVTIPNTGVLPALNVTLLDELPVGFNLIPDSIIMMGASGPVVGSIDTPPGLTIGSIPAGGTATVTFEIRVDTLPPSGNYQNEVQITYTDATGKPGGGIVTGPVIDILPPGTGGSNLGNTSKFVDNGNPRVGEIVEYTIEIPNTGTETAVDVRVFDALALGLTLVGTPVVTGTVGSVGGNLLVAPGLRIGSILPGTTATVTFQVRVNALPTPNPYLNEADITYTDSTGTTTFPAKGGNLNVGRTNGADLGEATKKASTNSPQVGDGVTYTITIPNNGPAAATNVIVYDNLPPEIELVEIVSVTGASGPVTGELNVLPGLNIGTIPAGATAVITFTVAVEGIPNPNPFLNEVDITFTDPTGTYTHPVSGGALTVTPSTGADLTGAIKEGSDEVIVVGTPMRYTVTIPNTGILPALDVTVLDELPPEFSFVPDSIEVMGASGPVVGNPTVAPGLNIGTIQPGATAVVSFEIVANELPEPPSFTNRAIITYTDANGKPGTGVVTSPPQEVIGAEVTMNKRSDRQEVAVGDIVTYYVDIENTGNIPVDQVTIVDLLDSELQFVEGSVELDGMPYPDASILSGVVIPHLEVDEKVTLSFKAEVLAQGTVSNQVTAEYIFRPTPDAPEQAGRDVSNVLEINASEVDLTVTKEADTEFAVLGDTIHYTITIRNTTPVVATNIVVKDELPRYLELVPGTFTVDGQVVNNVDLDAGVNIGDIDPRETVIITYDVKIISTSCSSTIENGVELNYSYILPDGSVGRTTLLPEGDSLSVIDMGISNFKQLSIESYLTIPEVKPNVEAINLATGVIDIKNCHVIETPINHSMEHQRLTGYKLVVHGMLKLVIEYTALDTEQSVHSAHYSVPFSTFIVLPQDYEPGSKLEVEGIVEDIYYNLVDIRNFFHNTTALINVKILFC